MDSAKHTQFGGVNVRMGRQDGSYKYNLNDMGWVELVKYSIEQETNSVENELRPENLFEGDLIIQLHFLNKKASTDPQKCFLEAVTQLVMNGKDELPDKLFVAQQSSDDEPRSHT